MRLDSSQNACFVFYDTWKTFENYMYHILVLVILKLGWIYSYGLPITLLISPPWISTLVRQKYIISSNNQQIWFFIHLVIIFIIQSIQTIKWNYDSIENDDILESQKIWICDYFHLSW